MIHAVTYATMSHDLQFGGFGLNSLKVDSWKAIDDVLTHTGDHIVWIVTKSQLASFLDKIKVQGLEKYLVVAHRHHDHDGTTNRNYPGDRKKLKVFIMKGAK